MNKLRKGMLLVAALTAVGIIAANTYTPKKKVDTKSTSKKQWFTLQ